MRFTTDTYSGKRYGWDTTVREGGTNLVTVGKMSDGSYLHPSRVPLGLLTELNERPVSSAETRKEVGK